MRVCVCISVFKSMKGHSISEKLNTKIHCALSYYAIYMHLTLFFHTTLLFSTVGMTNDKEEVLNSKLCVQMWY